MSADAKLWIDTDGRDWKGLHDGPCHAIIPHDQGGSLLETLQGIEACTGGTLRWEFRTYPKTQQIGLVGYHS